MSTLVGGTGIIGQDIFCSFGNGKYTTFEGTEIVVENCLKARVKDLVVEGKTYQNLFKAELSQGHVNSSLSSQEVRVNSEGFNLAIKKFTISVPAGFEILVYPNYVSSASAYVLWANKIVWSNSSESNNIRIMVKKTDNSEITVDEVIGKVILLEGDYTDADLPDSIDGIESVAERESINLLENVEWNDGFINMDTGEIETLTSYANAKYSELIDVNINQLYKTNINESNSALRIRIYKSDGTYIKIASSALTLNSFANLYKIGSTYAGITKIRLLALDTVKYPLPTKPYVIGNNEDINYPYPINLNNEGKNLINLNDMEYGNINKDTGKNLATITSMTRTINYISVIPKTTYIINTSCRVFEYDKDKNFLSSTAMSGRFTTSENTEYIKFHGNTTTEFVNGKNIQLEEGTVTTSYEPYREPIITNINLPIPLRSLPNGVANTIEGDKLVQRVGKVVLNGTQAMTLANVNQTETTRVRIVMDNAKISNKNNLICNWYIRTGAHGDYEYIIIQDSSAGICLFISVSNSKLDTVDLNGIEKYFKENPLPVYYELAEPIIHDLTVPQLSTAKGTNIITTSNNIKPKISMKVKVK